VPILTVTTYITLRYTFTVNFRHTPVFTCSLGFVLGLGPGLGLGYWWTCYKSACHGVRASVFIKWSVGRQRCTRGRAMQRLRHSCTIWLRTWRNRRTLTVRWNIATVFVNMSQSKSEFFSRCQCSLVRVPPAMWFCYEMMKQTVPNVTDADGSRNWSPQNNYVDWQLPQRQFYEHALHDISTDREYSDTLSIKAWSLSP